MSALSQSKILELHAAIIAAGLVESRRGLLAGIDERVVARLSRAGTQAEQLLCDLSDLNIGADAHGVKPLLILLSNAATLADPRVEAAMFRRLSEQLGEIEGPAREVLSLEEPPTRPIDVRLFNIAAAQEWTIGVARGTTLLQLIGEFKTLLRVVRWGSSGIPKPGPGYNFRFYRSEMDADPLSPHVIVGELCDNSARSLSLNIEWYRVFRGTGQVRMR